MDLLGAYLPSPFKNQAVRKQAVSSSKHALPRLGSAAEQL